MYRQVEFKTRPGNGTLEALNDLVPYPSQGIVDKRMNGNAPPGYQNPYYLSDHQPLRGRRQTKGYWCVITNRAPLPLRSHVSKATLATFDEFPSRSLAWVLYHTSLHNYDIRYLCFTSRMGQNHRRFFAVYVVWCNVYLLLDVLPSSTHVSKESVPGLGYTPDRASQR